MDRSPELMFTDEVASRRKPDYDILPLFLNRWSPRSMSGEPLSEDELLPLFEAARWAPSSYNAQLWRFIVARRQDPTTFSAFLNLLAAGNAEWAKDASGWLRRTTRCSGSSPTSGFPARALR